MSRGAAAGLADRLRVDLSASVRSLSKGNRQKLGIIQAFQHAPALLVLDEPTSGLDPLMQREFLALVREARDAGSTILLSSHQISEIQQAADEVVLLKDGEVVARSTVDDLRAAAPRHVVVRADGIDADELRLRLGASLTDATFEAGRASGILHGPVAALVSSVGALPVTDLVVEEPDLEQVVLGRYGGAS
ncbi:hypothetical protein GCM10025867_17130 [Frondihabitans sucicola]|uniref:ATPase AAA-type core domain-containing protein n=1 Tax=Frondihabitans sucicola TaxID=1268041 RepID=A0ABM8GM29_9MICO|nr:AAA family ATPase [Frondihabitans sucicola]BDZ49472.1 hypothetical protein GCM10025867_17130 [Frondihabitans sucicola]